MKLLKSFVSTVFIVLIVVGCSSNNLGNQQSNNSPSPTANTPVKESAEEIARKDEERKAKEAADAKAAAEQKAKEDAEAKIPREYKAALKSAETYAETMNMSKAGIYDQLISEYGENFPKEAAQYAIDNIVFDWKENALKSAETYAETMNMSDKEIYNQLISEYGEKFTKEEAQYAIDNLQ